MAGFENSRLFVGGQKKKNAPPFTRIFESLDCDINITNYASESMKSSPIAIPTKRGQEFELMNECIYHSRISPVEVQDELEFYLDDDIFKHQIEDALHSTNQNKQERFNQDLKLWEEAMKKDDIVNHITQVFESALIM